MDEFEWIMLENSILHTVQDTSQETLDTIFLKLHQWQQDRIMKILSSSTPLPVDVAKHRVDLLVGLSMLIGTKHG